jgi:hypothetical protein
MSDVKPGDTFSAAMNRSGDHILATDQADPIATKLYGLPGGEPGGLSEIRTALSNGGFESIAYQARFGGDHAFAKELDQSRDTLAGVMREVGFSRDAAGEIAGIVKQYFDKPRSKESAEKGFETALEALQKRWGGDFEANLAGAVELLGTLRKKDPAFSNFLAATGAQNNERLLEILGETARHRKATAKK